MNFRFEPRSFPILLSWGLLGLASTLVASEPEVLFRGVPEAWHPTLRASLTLSKERCGAPRWRIRHLFAQAESELRTALRAFGHYRLKIEKRLIFSSERGCWRAIFRIHPGPPVRIARVELEISGPAARDPHFRELLARSPLRRGQVLHHGRYERFKKRLLALAFSRGYFRARWKRHELRVDPQRLRADIVLHLDSGPRFRIGEIRFPPLQELDPNFLRRFLPFREGDFYDRQGIEALQRALLESGYFRDVEVIPLREEALGPSREIPIEIRLALKKRHLLSFGIGFDTNLGPRAELRYENRYLNRRGHRFTLKGRYSFVRSEVAGELLIPWRRPLAEWFSFGANFLHEETDTFKTRSVLFGNRFHHWRASWQEVMGFDFRYEVSDFQNRGRRLLLLMPTIGWRRTEKDHPTVPQKGFRFELDWAAGFGLTSQVPTFFRGHLFFKAIQRLPWSARLLGRLEAGGLLAKDFQELPASQRFWTGGFDSIRGFGYKQLGEGGGRSLLVGSLEYEQKIASSFGVALFADGGGAYARLKEPTFIGVGIGLRWFSPIGPIRLDLATPVRGKSPRVRVHISMGPDL